MTLYPEPVKPELEDYPSWEDYIAALWQYKDDLGRWLEFQKEQAGLPPEYRL